MKKIGQCRFFADHYQFYLHDSNVDFLSDLPQWTESYTERGYIANGQVIGVSTRAHLNDHWVEIYIDDASPDVAGYDRSFWTELQISSGRLSVRGLADVEDDVYCVEVLNARYRAHILTANLGIDQYSTGEINDEDDEVPTDEELAARTDIERYVIVLQKER